MNINSGEFLVYKSCGEGNTYKFWIYNKGMRKRAISLSAMEKVLKRIGADRVSESGKEALREVLEEYGEDVGRRAWELAKHSKRKTIRSTDIRLAIR